VEHVADQVRQLEERLLDPGVRASPQELDDLLADEFVEFGASGRTFDKRQIIESLGQESAVVRRWLTGFTVTVLAPDVVLATYRSARQDSAEARPVHSLRCSIWKRTEGRWQIVFHQGTPADEGRARRGAGRRT
jgi:hypothetical protein